MGWNGGYVSLYVGVLTFAVLSLRLGNQGASCSCYLVMVLPF